MDHNPISWMVSIIAAAVIMVIIPVIWTSQKAEYIAFEYADRTVKEWIETVSARGYIDEESYAALVEKLNATGSVYDIDITHTQKIYEPEYVAGVFSGNVMEYTEEKYTWEILDSLDADGAYILDIGDEISVKASKRGVTLGQTLVRMVLKRQNTGVVLATRSVSGQSAEMIEKYLH